MAPQWLSCPRCQVMIPVADAARPPAQCPACSATIASAEPLWYYAQNKQKLGPVPLAQLRALGGEVAVALEHEGRLRAILVLGPKSDGGTYSHEDLDLLAKFAPFTALALASAAPLHGYVGAVLPLDLCFPPIPPGGHGAIGADDAAQARAREFRQAGARLD